MHAYTLRGRLDFSSLCIDRNEAEFIHEIIQWVDSRIAYHTPLSAAKYPMGKEVRVQDIYRHSNIRKNDNLCKVIFTLSCLPSYVYLL